MQASKSISWRTLAVFILLSFLGGIIVSIDTFNHIETQKQAVLKLAGAESNVLTQRLNAAISAAYTLEAILRENQFIIQPERFEAFANQIINHQLAVASLQYAPGGIVTYVVPSKGNEAIIGHNLFDDIKRNKEAFDAVEKHLLTVAGPFELIQGGIGLVARLPIFRTENQEEKFWGFASVLIRVSELIEPSGLYNLSSRGYEWILWRNHPDTGLPYIFSGTTNSLIEDPVQLAIAVPNATWFLSIKPHEGWLSGHSLRMTLGIGIFLAIAGVGACLAFLLQRQPLLLQQQVELQTKELQEAYLKLQDSEYRYRSLVENTDDLITRVDRDGRLLYVNSSALKYWGLPAEECLGQPAFDFICPEDRERTISHFQNWLKTESDFTTFENRQLHTSGESTGMQWMVASLRDSSGEIVAFSGIARDISERLKIEESLLNQNEKLTATEETLRVQINEYESSQKLLRESEERFKALHNASFGGVIIHEKGLILDCNQGLSDITGFSNEELVGMDGLKLIAPDSLDLVLRNIKSGYDQPYEVEGVRKDGSVYPLAIRGKNIPYKGREVRVIEFRDISELKHAEEQRQKFESQLQQAHKMEAIGTLAGGIAHDFNNLLAIISGNIDVMQHKHKSGNSSKENVEHIKNATSQAKNLVMQILAFSRQEKHELEPVDLCIVVGEVLELFHSTIPATIEIAATIEGGPMIIKADTTQLQQVFINLCTNAVQAMDEKGLLKINLAEVEPVAHEIPGVVEHQTGKYAKLSISDTGSGMNPESIGRIFEPFFTTKGIGLGTGMGLSVVHGIVEQHSGFITVDSTPGQGTTFDIYFPTIRKVVTVLKTDTAESLPTGTERILFVDDEECIADTCRELLEYQGYKVTSVTSSIEALEIFKANPDEFDLIFTDQTMPKMSGTELAAELLKIRQDLSIILCSGYSSKVSEERAKGIGIREFCMKPMDMKKLAIVARKVLDENNN